MLDLACPAHSPSRPAPRARVTARAAPPDRDRRPVMAAAPRTGRRCRTGVRRRPGARHHGDRRPHPARLDSGLRHRHRRGRTDGVARVHDQRGDAQGAGGVRARRGRPRPATEPERSRPESDTLEQDAAARGRHPDRLCPVWRQRDLLPPAGRTLRPDRSPEGLGPDRLWPAHGRRGDQLHHAAGAGRPRGPAGRFVRQQGLP